MRRPPEGLQRPVFSVSVWDLQPWEHSGTETSPAAEGLVLCRIKTVGARKCHQVAIPCAG